ncbi:unnamed protein product [Chrysoparadoxa australica]
MWIDRTNWTNDAVITLMSEELGTDSVLGSTQLSVLPFMQVLPADAKEEVVALELEGSAAGELVVKATFLPAGKLTITCRKGRGLREATADTDGRQDPYVVFKSDGQALAVNRKTQVDKDGGTQPVWNDVLEMDIVDQYSLSIECLHHSMMDGAAEIGSTTFSLLPVFKRGRADGWIQLNHQGNWGAPKAAGEINVLFEFVGPPGLAFPQHQPGVDAFDDSQRVNLKGYLAEEEEEGGEEQSAIVAVGGSGEITVREGGEEAEFSEEEILSAFKFLDLDKNNYIGAAEIRHILICMGELITDEEVDMMITMVDGDGDGQVSYEEFHRLVTDPDPAREDFLTEPIDDTGIMQEDFDRQKEQQDREAKKWLMEEFVKENEIGETEMMLMKERWAKQMHLAVDGCVEFEQWVDIMNVEVTGQYRKLFLIFAKDDANEEATRRIDIKEFMLGCLNFFEMDKTKRIQFIFDLFDEDRSGFLSMGELVEVLKANHMQSSVAVKKKAQTIMAQADDDGSGTLSFDEFLVVSKKFPHVLMPQMKKAEDEANRPLAIQGAGG